MFAHLRQHLATRKLLHEFDDKYSEIVCDVLYIPVFAHQKLQYGMAALLDIKFNHVLAKALKSGSFSGHLTEYMWFIPKSDSNIRSVCFFGVGSKEDLNPAIFQSIFNQAKQQQVFKTAHSEALGRKYVISLNFSGKKDRLIEV